MRGDKDRLNRKYLTSHGYFIYHKKAGSSDCDSLRSNAWPGSCSTEARQASVTSVGPSVAIRARVGRVSICLSFPRLLEATGASPRTRACDATDNDHLNGAWRVRDADFDCLEMVAHVSGIGMRDGDIDARTFEYLMKPITDSMNRTFREK